MSKVFKCEKCGKEFKKKVYYENHIFKVGLPCDYKIITTINGKSLSKVDKKSTSSSATKTPPLKENIFSDDLTTDFEVDILKNDRGQYECPICGKDFVSMKKWRNHFEKKRCFDGNTKNELVNRLLKTIKEKNISDEKTKNNGTQIHNHINTQIFMTNNEITNNIINNSVNIFQDNFEGKVNAFGKENLGILTDEMLDGIVGNPDGGIVKLIKYIHFNPDVPENRNIVIKNKKDPYFNVFNGEYWEKQDRDLAVHNLITTKKDIMDDHYETMQEKNLVTNFLRKNYTEFSDLLDPYLKDDVDKLLMIKMKKNKIEKNCSNIYKKLYGKIVLLMLNDKELSGLLQRKIKDK